MRRVASVAGSWYPDEPTRLASDLAAYLKRASAASGATPPRALIVPHAGLMYSGPVAACAYALVAGASYRAAILVGPSHFVPFDGVAIWGAGEWDTPFGPLAVDVPLAQAIRAACTEVIDLPAAHRREHSLEMQLPFLAHLLPGVPIVPLVMGHQTRATAFALGDALAQTVGKDADVLFIASSDLSHYENATVASQMDAIIVRHVDAFDPEGLMTALEQDPRHACGGGPMVSVLRAARLLGASSARVLCYADSGDVSGDKSAVVGYLAAAIE